MTLLMFSLCSMAQRQSQRTRAGVPPPPTTEEEALNQQELDKKAQAKREKARLYRLRMKEKKAAELAGVIPPPSATLSDSAGQPPNAVPGMSSDSVSAGHLNQQSATGLGFVPRGSGTVPLSGRPDAQQPSGSGLGSAGPAPSSAFGSESQMEAALARILPAALQALPQFQPPPHVPYYMAQPPYAPFSQWCQPGMSSVPPTAVSTSASVAPPMTKSRPSKRPLPVVADHDHQDDFTDEVLQIDSDEEVEADAVPVSVRRQAKRVVQGKRSAPPVLEEASAFGSMSYNLSVETEWILFLFSEYCFFGNCFSLFGFTSLFYVIFVVFLPGAGAVRRLVLPLLLPRNAPVFQISNIKLFKMSLNSNLGVCCWF